MARRKAQKQRLREERLVHQTEAERRRSRDRRLKLGGVGIFFVGVAIAIGASLALGGSEDEGDVGSQGAPQAPATEATKGLAKRLAANRAQASQLIDGSTEALEAKLAELRGHPVVVNQWGSWCPPCRAEFPFFAESADAHAADELIERHAVLTEVGAPFGGAERGLLAAAAAAARVPTATRHDCDGCDGKPHGDQNPRHSIS